MVSATLPLSVEEIELLQQQLQIYKDALLNTTLTVHEFDTGDTAWVLTSTALILFMTLPGLILYYIGMIRVQNVLTTAMHVFSIACVITACWFFLGYSLAFAPVGTERESSPVYGDATRGFLFGVHADTFHQLAPTIPEPIFCAFQLTFAIITPALIWGSLADRMKYESLLAFIVFWHFLVYCPVAHSTWHPDGFLYKAGVLDFAGGLVVHLSAGISGLVTTIILKPRIGLGSKKEDNDPMLLPHNIPLTICGSCMLWVGWFGFNAGSALHANGLASVAFLNTFISAGFATLSWLVVEFAFSSKCFPPPPFPLASYSLFHRAF